MRVTIWGRRSTRNSDTNREVVTAVEIK